MEETRHTLLSELHGISLQSAVERLLEVGVLDAGALSARRDEHLRRWRDRSEGRLGDELEALRRQARQQRRHAAAQVEETRRQRLAAGDARETVVQLDEHRVALSRRREVARAELAESAAALDAAHRALGAALAALTLIGGDEEPYPTAAPSGLDIESEARGDRVVLRLRGEIDISTAGRLDDALADATASGAEEVWVDLVNVTFMDSTGIAALLRATHVLPGPRRLAVICPDGPARRALELCGLGQLLPLHAAPPS